MSKKFLNIIISVMVVLLAISSAAPITLSQQPPSHLSTTVITSLPYTISSPGVYVLNSDLIFTGSGYDPAIQVDSSEVYIIGNGHKIESATGSGVGISTGQWDATFVVDDLDIVNFRIGVNITDAGDDYSPYSNDFLLNNVNIVGFSEEGIRVYDNYVNVILKDVNINSPATTTAIGMNITTGGNIIITDSNFQGTSTALYIEDTSDITIIQSSFIDNRNYALFATDIYSLTLASSTIQSSSTIYSNEVHFTDSSDIAIFRNTFNGINRVYFETSNDIQVVHNFFNNNDIGVWTEDVTSYFAVYGNIFYQNNHAVHMNFGPSTTSVNNIQFENNVFRGNQVPVMIVQDDWLTVTNSFLTNNQFIDNPDIVYYLNNGPFDASHLFPFTNNYYSDYTGTPPYNIPVMDPLSNVLGNIQDSTPTTNPKQELYFDFFEATQQYGNNTVTVEIKVTNYGAGNATNVPLELFYTLEPEFQQVPFGWVPITESLMSGWPEGSWYENDYGNYTIYDEDDDNILWQSPFPIEFYGEYYENISMSTNGYIELLNNEYQQNVNEQGALEDDYNTFTYLYLYYLQYDFLQDYRWNAGWPTDNITSELVIYGLDGDLSTEDDMYEGIAYLQNENAIVVTYLGSTYEDEDSADPIHYQIILSQNGTMRINIEELDSSELDGTGFTGIASVFPFANLFTASIQPASYTSYVLKDTRLHTFNNTLIDVPAGATATLLINFTHPTTTDPIVVGAQLPDWSSEQTRTLDRVIFQPIKVFFPNFGQLTTQQRQALDDLDDLLNQTNRNPMNDTNGFNNVLHNLFDTDILKKDLGLKDLSNKEELKHKLEALYGEKFVNYPTDEGMMYLLWLFYVEE